VAATGNPYQTMKKKWVIKEQGHPEMVSKLSAELNISRILSNILVQRGFDTFEKAKEFFRPSLSMLHDPFLMKDMDLAVKRIREAVSRKEKILVYG
jgi:single-stranded-DNA-specific exonuclease